MFRNDVLIDILSHVTDKEDIANVGKIIASFVGADWVTFGCREYSLKGTAYSKKPPLPFFSNSNSQWRERYRNGRYHQIDPAHKLTSRGYTGRYFLGDDLPDASWSSDNQLLMDMASEHSQNSAFILPCIGQVGATRFVFILGSSQTGDRFYPALRENERQIHLGLSLVAAKVEQLWLSDTGLVKEELNSNEVECLKWCALGKSASEVSDILNIAEEAAARHIRNAVSKLDCISLTQAISKALVIGLISL